MKNRLLAAILAVSVVVLMASCDLDLFVQVFLGDIQAVFEEPSSELYTTATLSLEAGSEDSKPKAIEFIKNNFREARNFRDEKRDFSDYIVADFKVRLINGSQKTNFSATDDLIYIAAKPSEDEGTLLGILFNNAKFESINEYIKETYYQTISIKDVGFSLKIENDIRKPVTIRVGAVYANNEPVPYYREYDLAHRDSLSIRFSDVLRDSFGKSDSAFFAEISKLN
jgi:hypothetical protein